VKYSINQKGLTLVEIAIVMVIMGILITIGAGMLGPLTKRAKQAETDGILNGAVDAVMAYATINKRLPVWTDSNDPVLSPNEFHYILRSRNDAWSGPLFYRHSNNPDLSTTDICAATTTNLRVSRCGTDVFCATPQTTSNVALVIYSRGPNVNYQTVLPGPPPPPPVIPPPGLVTAYMYDPGISMRITNRVSGLIAIPNTQPPQTISDPVDNTAAICTANGDLCKYDDIVKFVTLTELKTKIGCTKYDLCSAGITVANQSGGNLYYRLNGGACTAWANTTNISLITTNSYQVFSDAACTTACVPQSNLNYFQQKDLDLNNNCQTRVNPGCQMIDQ
jgi:prepilin-type N-terminal cleavage/methylation domain-containing protein